MSRLRSAVTVTHATLLLLVASVSMNVLQARRIQDLVEPTPRAESRVGEVAPAVDVVDLEGRPTTLTFTSDLPTVVYFFSPTCVWCEENWDNVRALARARAGRFRLVAVAAERDLKTFVGSKALDFEVLGGISLEARRALGLGGTPHTLVVSSRGSISHEWIGAFSGSRQRGVEAFFELDLPGLASPPASRRAK